jgi:hypothetical protein
MRVHVGDDRVETDRPQRFRLAVCFVEVGQRVVKAEAFPFMRCGTMRALCRSASREAVDQRETTTLTDALGATVSEVICAAGDEG